MDKIYLVREILLIGRAVDKDSISKKVLALTNILGILDRAIMDESFKPGFSIYVAHAEANLIWNICFKQLSDSGIYIGTPYTYQMHSEGLKDGFASLCEVTNVN